MSIKILKVFYLTLIGVAVASCGVSTAGAQNASTTLNKGKQLNLIVGGAAGGGYDAYARLLARHMGQYLAGQPTIVVQDMPGAGGNKAADFLFSVVPKDGSVIGEIFPGAIMEPLLGEQGKVRHDSTKFIYLGSANNETSVCILRSDSDVKRFEDTFTHTIVLGATAPGASTSDFPLILNAVIGTKFKIVTGYSGTSAISLAMERGEVAGFCSDFWSSLTTEHPDWITSEKFNIIVQEALKGRPELDKKGIPVAYNYAKTEADKQALELIYAPLIFGRPFLAPPGVPADRSEALRTAFSAAMSDKLLREDADKARLQVDPIMGDDVQTLINKLYSIPEAVVQRTRVALKR